MADKKFDLAIIVSSNVKGAVSGLSSLGKTVGKLGAAAAGMGTVVVGGLGLVGAGLTKLAIDAAPLGGIKSAFEGISEASGKSSKDMIKALKEGSFEMITQRNLMKSYNLAASLVGDQFANQLPEAMGYLSKVAAGTGEDMDYMMDSLVRGIGRLSPMILDNLGIQVSLSEAYEAFAPTVGKTASELNKQEQQIALTNQVMERLAENTAAMPSVAGTAATGIAALKAKFADLKDMAGLHLLPVLSTFLDILLDGAEKIFPKVVVGFESLAKVLDPLLKYFVAVVEDGDYMNDWLTQLPEGIQGFVESIGKFISEGIEGGGGLIEEMKTAIEGGWPGIKEKLWEWGSRFWDWLTEIVVPFATEKLEVVSNAIQTWAESEETQARLGEFGATVGQGLVEGVRMLGGAVETWTPVMMEISGALSEAVGIVLIPAAKLAAKSFVDGFVQAIIVELSLVNFLAMLQGGESSIAANVRKILGLPVFPSFQTGGMMSGAPTQAGLAILHGGERVTPAGGRGRTDQLLERILGALETLVSKDTVVVVETTEGGAARDHLLSLVDQAYALSGV